MFNNIFNNCDKKYKNGNSTKKNLLALLLILPLALSSACNRESEIAEKSQAAIINSSTTSIDKVEDSIQNDKNSTDSNLVSKSSQKKDDGISSKTRNLEQTNSSSEISKGISNSINNSSIGNNSHSKNRSNETTTQTEQSESKNHKSNSARNSANQADAKISTNRSASNTSATKLALNTKLNTNPSTETTNKTKPTSVSTTPPIVTEKQTISVSLTISLQSVKNNPKALPEHQQKLLVPESGYIANNYHVEVKEGTTVVEVLRDYLNKNNIHYDIQDHQFGAYVAGINNIYEFDAGKNSGWMYKVNGILPNYGVGKYKLKDGDDILLFYTIDYNDEGPF